MVVWNTFENDARVLREATSLFEAGYHVTVVALHSPGLTQRREVLCSGVKVYRVLRSPLMLLPFYRRRQERLSKGRLGEANHVKERGDENASVLSGREGKVRVFLKILYRALSQFLMLVALIRLRPHVVHAHDANTLFVGWLAACISRARLVYDAHEISTDREGYAQVRSWVALTEKYLMPRADASITTTDRRAAFFARAYNVPRPTVIQNRCMYRSISGSRRLYDELGLSEDWPIVLYQGGIQSGRGLAGLVRAAASVKQAYFVFIGDGRQQGELKQLSDDLGLTDRIYFLPKVSLDVLPEYTASADIGVQPIRNTCLNHLTTDSNKLFEYAMGGLAIVASNLPEIRSVVKGYDIGLLFDPDDLGDLEKALCSMVEQPETRARYQANAVASRTALSWEAHAPRLLNLYAQLELW